VRRQRRQRPRWGVWVELPDANGRAQPRGTPSRPRTDRSCRQPSAGPDRGGLGRLPAWVKAEPSHSPQPS